MLSTPSPPPPLPTSKFCAPPSSRPVKFLDPDRPVMLDLNKLLNERGRKRLFFYRNEVK